MKKQRILIASICSAAAIIIAAIAIFALTMLDTPAPLPSSTPSNHISAVSPTPTAPIPTPTPEVTPEPTPDITPEPTPEATPEPTPEPTPQPTPEPTADPAPEVTPEPSHEPTTEPEPKPEQFKITFIGGVSPRGEPKDYELFTAIADLIQNDDLSIMNLESVISDVAAPVISEAHMAYTAWASTFRDTGIDFINMANPHVMGCGPEGYADTVTILKDNGIPYVGNREMSLYISQNDLLIGIYASDGGAGSNIKKSISALEQAGADLIIACLNWNNGTSDLYLSNEYHSAHYAIDCGADIVLGHNGTSVHYFETYNDALIIYGLGEYAGGYDISDSAAVLQLTLEYGEAGLYIAETACIPIKPGSHTEPPSALPIGSPEYNKVIHTLHSAPRDPDNENSTEDTSGEETETESPPDNASPNDLYIEVENGN